MNAHELCLYLYVRVQNKESCGLSDVGHAVTSNKPHHLKGRGAHQLLFTKHFKVVKVVVNNTSCDDYVFFSSEGKAF